MKIKSRKKIKSTIKSKRRICSGGFAFSLTINNKHFVIARSLWNGIHTILLFL